MLHKVFFSSYFVLANHAATPAKLPFGTRADTEKIVIFLWANSATLPLYYRSNPKKRAGNSRIFLFKILSLRTPFLAQKFPEWLKIMEMLDLGR